VVALNRRLAHEMVRVRGGDWEVTAVAPRFMHGDLRPIELEPITGEACDTKPVRVRLSKRPHWMAYERSVRELLRAEWDLIHCWEEPYVFAGFQIARWTPPRVPFVFWTAQNIAKRYPPPFRWFEQYCLGRAAGWLACGRTTVDAQLTRGYGTKPYRILPLGVDTEVFRPDRAAGAAVRRHLGWDHEGPPVVGYIGRFVEEKGIRLLMRSLDALACRWRALFVGGGPLEPELRTWGLRQGDRVRIVTGVPHDRVSAHLNAMDLLAAPSQTVPRWKEQQGRMLIEAFACGVPVVGSDSGEIPHVIGDAGLVVEEADMVAWVESLGELIDNPKTRADLGRRGRQRAEREYAWPLIARRHLQFFDTLLSPDRPASQSDPTPSDTMPGDALEPHQAGARGR
jgi:glycosyltransferase involved in cell wall biosynthesis